MDQFEFSKDDVIGLNVGLTLCYSDWFFAVYIQLIVGDGTVHIWAGVDDSYGNVGLGMCQPGTQPPQTSVAMLLGHDSADVILPMAHRLGNCTHTPRFDDAIRLLLDMIPKLMLKSNETTR